MASLMKPSSSWMPRNLIEVRNLERRFGDQTVLSGMSLDVREGEILCLLGPSGCGKTVFLKVLAGLLERTGGTISRQSPGVSMAFQKSPLFPWLTVLENLEICGFPRERSLEYLDRAHLGRFRFHHPKQISGGMQQKVNILRSFLSEAPLVLMDEPFVFLDFLQRTELQEFTLDIWQRERKTIVFVTHDIDEAILMADRILVMSGGPGRIIREFEVRFGRPRDPGALRGKQEYSSLFAAISKTLGDEIRKLHHA